MSCYEQYQLSATLPKKAYWAFMKDWKEAYNALQDSRYQSYLAAWKGIKDGRYKVDESIMDFYPCACPLTTKDGSAVERTPAAKTSCEELLEYLYRNGINRPVLKPRKKDFPYLKGKVLSWGFGEDNWVIEIDPRSCRLITEYQNHVLKEVKRHPLTCLFIQTLKRHTTSDNRYERYVSEFDLD